MSISSVKLTTAIDKFPKAFVRGKSLPAEVRSRAQADVSANDLKRCPNDANADCQGFLLWG